MYAQKACIVHLTIQDMSALRCPYFVKFSRFLISDSAKTLSLNMSASGPRPYGTTNIKNSDRIHNYLSGIKKDTRESGGAIRAIGMIVLLPITPNLSQPTQKPQWPQPSIDIGKAVDANRLPTAVVARRIYLSLRSVGGRR